MRFFAEPLDAEQIAFTHRRMPPQTGGRGSYGHSHKTQEEIYFVLSGRLEFKLDDEVIDVGPGTAVRVAPAVVRSVWNNGPEDAQLVIVSTKIEGGGRADAELVEDFWPD
jgi:mannose-6-phosphate isomerase-like protein (cupin superfamily)